MACAHSHACIQRGAQRWQAGGAAGLLTLDGTTHSVDERLVLRSKAAATNERTNERKDDDKDVITNGEDARDETRDGTRWRNDDDETNE